MTQAEINRNRTRVFVDGKSLRDISEMTGVRYDTIKRRYYNGETTMDAITAKRKPRRMRYDEMLDRGKKIYTAMQEKNMTLGMLSKRSGVERTSISRYMYGETELASMRLAKVCATLGISMDYVMGLKSNEG